MGKPDTNVGKQALQEGKTTCQREDLLTECINICKKLEIPCVTEGERREPGVKLKIKRHYGGKMIKKDKLKWKNLTKSEI